MISGCYMVSLKQSTDCNSTAVEDKSSIREWFIQKMNIYMRLPRLLIACNCEYGVNAEIYDIQYDILPYH